RVLFRSAVVRQFEIRGSFALNSGDALDRLFNPLATRQRLAARSVPIPVETFVTDAPPKRKASQFASIYRFLVVGGDIAAAVERRLGRELDASERPLPEERAIALAAAEALDLRLASIDVGETANGPVVLGVSANPSIGTFETITGTRVAEAVIAAIETGVRSWRRVAPFQPQRGLVR